MDLGSAVLTSFQTVHLRMSGCVAGIAENELKNLVSIDYRRRSPVDAIFSSSTNLTDEILSDVL